jgi:hypothetical protein
MSREELLVQKPEMFCHPRACSHEVWIGNVIGDEVGEFWATWYVKFPSVRWDPFSPARIEHPHRFVGWCYPFFMSLEHFLEAKAQGY